MATAKLNPVIESISGRMGNAVFYCRYNRQCVRTYVVPANTDTAARRKVRRNFAVAVKLWQQMTKDQKYAYTKKARLTGMSGYNLFISFFITGRMTQPDKYRTVYKNAPFTRNNKHQNRIHTVSIPFIPQDNIKMYTFAADTG